MKSDFKYSQKAASTNSKKPNVSKKSYRVTFAFLICGEVENLYRWSAQVSIYAGIGKMKDRKAEN